MVVEIKYGKGTSKTIMSKKFEHKKPVHQGSAEELE
jgi:hypothetical protein